MIDNPAVSHYHARVFHEENRLMLEDGSMNGTFVNGQRVKMVSLKPGDPVGIGKHTIVVSEAEASDNPAPENNENRAPQFQDQRNRDAGYESAPRAAGRGCR